MNTFKPLKVPLFVPGHRSELLVKAASSGADAVIMDLEDAVSPADKPAAHKAILERPDIEIPLLIRTNAFESEWFAIDLDHIAQRRPSMVMLPKAESADHVELIRQKLGHKIPVLPIVESAAGLASLGEMLCHPSVFQVAFGHLDFALDIGASSDWECLHYARGKMVLESRLASKAAPLDGVSVRFDDMDVVAQESSLAKAMGFGGKLLIHPKQIEPAKAVFLPSVEDYEWARRVMAAVADNVSAVQLDGSMIDAPVIKRAQLIIRDFESFG